MPTGTGNGTLSYILPDHLGSASVITNDVGAVVSKMAYWPYGATRSGGITQTDKRYTGQQEEPGDAALGLYNYKARFYSTTLGRFMSADPTTTDGLNRYTYVRNSPATFSDPSGFCILLPGKSKAERCSAKLWKQVLRCGTGRGCQNEVFSLFRAGIEQEGFWKLGAKYHRESLLRFRLEVLDITLDVAAVWGERGLNRISALGWETIGGMWDQPGRWFKATFADILFSTDRTRYLGYREIVGASDWWGHNDILPWLGHWDREYGFNIRGNRMIGAAWWRKTVLAGENLSSINDRPWSEAQLDLLDGYGLNVDKARARNAKNLAGTEAVQCLDSLGGGCSWNLDWKKAFDNP